MDKKQANKAITEVVSFISNSEFSKFFDFSDYRIEVGYSDGCSGICKNPPMFIIKFKKIIEKPSGNCKSERYAIGYSAHTFRVFIYENEFEFSSSKKEFERWGSIEKERKEFDEQL